MRVIVNGEQREIASASVDALLARARIRRHAFRDRAQLRRGAEEPLGRDGAESWRRDRDHHAAAGRVMMMTSRAHHSAVISPGLTGRPDYAAASVSQSLASGVLDPRVRGMTSDSPCMRGRTTATSRTCTMLNLLRQTFSSRLLIGTRAAIPRPRSCRRRSAARAPTSSRCRCGARPPAARPAMRSGR